MKRLFQVESTSHFHKGHPVGIPYFEFDYRKREKMQWPDEYRYFENKQDAKAWRDILNESEKKNFKPGVWENLPPGRKKEYCVSKGPDHIGNHGHNVPRMRRQPK